MKMKFIIPVGNLSKEEAEKQIADLISRYQKDINWKPYDRKNKIKRLFEL